MSARLNGLDLDQLRLIDQTARSNPEAVAALNRWSARVRWQDGFTAQALIRNHTLTLGEPADLAGDDAAPNAVEYVLAALGACLIVGFVFNATRRGIRLKNLELALDGQIDNIGVFLGLDQTGHPGYREISVKAYVDADADEAVLQEVWAETVRTSPVGNTLARQVRLKPELAVVSTP